MFFDLLSGWDREVSKSYGAFNFYEKTANRISFLIDKRGIINFKQSSTLNNPGNFGEMLEKVKEMDDE